MERQREMVSSTSQMDQQPRTSCGRGEMVRSTSRMNQGQATYRLKMGRWRHSQLGFTYGLRTAYILGAGRRREMSARSHGWIETNHVQTEDGQTKSKSQLEFRETTTYILRMVRQREMVRHSWAYQEPRTC